MITHGNKQISEIVYARKASEGGGSVRLTNIIRGAQVLFGDLYPALWWLTGATNTAILAAFGQTDGKAVIKATKAYLNALAATDSNKATAIVGFINEDPMLVCSLGLQPQGVQMPIRKLIPNSGSYIKTTVNARTDELSFDCIADLRGMTGYPATLFGVINSYTAGSGMYGFINHRVGGNAFRYGAHNSNYVASGVANNTDNVHLEGIVTDKAIELKLNGVSKGTASKGTPDNTEIFIFGANCRSQNGYYGGNQSRLGHLRLYTPSGDVGWFVPFIRSGVMECLDIVTRNIATRVGTFTESYTLPDGTPWTPLNQTL